MGEDRCSEASGQHKGYRGSQNSSLENQIARHYVDMVVQFY